MIKLILKIEEEKIIDNENIEISCCSVSGEVKEIKPSKYEKEVLKKIEERIKNGDKIEFITETKNEELEEKLRAIINKMV